MSYFFYCLGCGKTNCKHSQSYCENCSNNTTRTMTITAADAISCPDFRNFLEPSEYVYSSYRDHVNDDVILTIKKGVV